MPRPKSSPSYCIHSRSGRAYTTIDGQQVQLGPANSPESREAFDRVLGEWYANGRKLPQNMSAAKDAPRTGPTVAIVLDRFWTHAETYYTRPVLDDAGQPRLTPDGSVQTESTEQLAHYRQVIRLTRRLYGGLEATRFGCPELEALREMMIRPRTDPATGAIEAPWCRKHANRQVGRIKHIFGWAVTKGLVPVTVHQTLLLLPGLRIGKSAAKETAAVQPVDEAKALAVAKCASEQVGVMIQLQLLCGMRSTEVCIIRPCDIDRTVTPWQYTPMFHKTQEHDIARVIPIGPKAREILTPFLDRAATAFCFSPIEAEAKRRALLHQKRVDGIDEKKTTPLSCGNRPGTNRKAKPKRSPGNRFDRRSYYNAVKHACEIAFKMPTHYRSTPADYPVSGDSPAVVREKESRRRAKSAQRSKWHKENAWHPHQARHRAATDLRKAGSLDVAKVVLGHTSIKMTALYAEADVAAAHEVIERIG